LSTGKLKNKKVLITGGDSGIGRAVALMMAREGAKLSIVFLEQEMSDAKEVQDQIEKESNEFNNGSSCILIPLDLMDRDNCFKAVQSKLLINSLSAGTFKFRLYLAATAKPISLLFPSQNMLMNTEGSMFLSIIPAVKISVTISKKSIWVNIYFRFESLFDHHILFLVFFLFISLGNGSF
jgi:hypothetical protein